MCSIWQLSVAKVTSTSSSGSSPAVSSCLVQSKLKELKRSSRTSRETKSSWQSPDPATLTSFMWRLVLRYSGLLSEVRLAKSHLTLVLSTMSPCLFFSSFPGFQVIPIYPTFSYFLNLPSAYPTFLLKILLYPTFLSCHCSKINWLKTKQRK